jgi:hypothetical protein
MIKDAKKNKKNKTGICIINMDEAESVKNDAATDKVIKEGAMMICKYCTVTGPTVADVLIIVPYF